MPVSLVCCGLIGVLVEDSGMIDRAFAEAIATQGVVTGTTAYARCMARVHQTRGESAADVLQMLFPDSQARGQAAHLAFDRSCVEAIDRSGVSAVPGAEEAISRLADAGLRVCVLSGLSRRVLSALLDAIGWSDRLLAGAFGPDDVPRGFPWPDLALTAMLRLGVTDVRETAVAACTASGVLCGRRSGAEIVAGVLTGPHPAERLRRAGATHLIPSVADVPRLVATSADGTPRGEATGLSEF